MYTKEDLCLKAFFLLVKSLSVGLRERLPLPAVFIIFLDYTAKTATVLPCFVCLVGVSKINLKCFDMKPYYVFKASANYLQLTFLWKPAETLCLDLEILKFIGFPLT